MKISDEATALASVLLGILETEASGIRQAALGIKIQSALDAARDKALEDAGILVDATGYAALAKAIRALKVKL